MMRYYSLIYDTLMTIFLIIKSKNYRVGFPKICLFQLTCEKISELNKIPVDANKKLTNIFTSVI